MASETTTTTVTELIQASIGEARYTASQGVFLADPRFCTHRPLEPGKGSATFPIWDEEAMASVNEGTDLTNTAFDTTAVTITPGEYGLMTTVTDLADRRASEQLFVDIGRVMGSAYRDAVNQAFYALFDGFSTQVGGSNTDITEANILSGVRECRLGKAPGELFLACTPHVLEDLMTLYKASTSYTPDGLREEMYKTGILMPLFGVTPVMVDNLAAGTSAGQMSEADTKTGIWCKQAIGFVSEWDFRIETQRDASLRGTEIVATASFGLGELKDSYGVEVLVDNKD